MAKILLVHRDILECHRVRRWLTNLGHYVEVTDAEEDALSLVRHFAYDLIILGARIKDQSGSSLCRCMRGRGVVAPILIMGAENIPALEAGADETVRVPLNAYEIETKVSGLLRRPFRNNSGKFRFDYLSLDCGGRECVSGGTRVLLTASEFTLLELFMRNAGKVFSIDALQKASTSGKSQLPSRTAVRVRVSRLRKKVNRPGYPSLIRRTEGGYAFGRKENIADAEQDAPLSRKRVLVFAGRGQVPTGIYNWFDRERWLIQVVREPNRLLEALRGPEQYDLICAQIEGPQSIDALALVRREGIHAPLMAIVAGTEVPVQTAGSAIAAGADCCVPAYLSPVELALRFERMSKRSGFYCDTKLKRGDLVLNTSEGVVVRFDAAVKLPPREAALLALLMRNPERFLSHDEIISRLWPDDADVSATAIRLYVSRLRRRISHLSPGTYIRTLRGVGYRLDIA